MATKFSIEASGLTVDDLKKPYRDRYVGLVDALKSGSYRKATGCLKDRKGYCCLGVACDLVSHDNWQKNEFGDWFYSFKGIEECGFLPTTVQSHYGFNTKNGLYSKGKTLASLNDSTTGYGSVIKVLEAMPVDLFAEGVVKKSALKRIEKKSAISV